VIKTAERGFVHILGIIILLLGMVAAVYLVQTGNLKLFSRASTGARVDVAESTSPAGGIINVTYSDIPGPSVSDWVGIYKTDNINQRLDYNYVNSSGPCKKGRGDGVASGTCQFFIPIDYEGSYVIKLLSNDTNNVLATSTSFTVTKPTNMPTVTVNPANNVLPGGSITINWANIPTPTNGDWVALYSTTDTKVENYKDYGYLHLHGYCDKNTRGDSKVEGDCTLKMTANIPPGSYVVKLFSNTVYGLLATSSPFTVGTALNTTKRVFVTSSAYRGSSFLGLSGADAKCQSSATAASLGGNWKAWLSDNSISASDRLNKSNIVGYKLVDGTLIASNWTDLVDGTLQHAINKTEFGQPAGYTYAWTGTDQSGTKVSGNNCDNWGVGVQQPNNQGAIGDVFSTTQWSYVAPNSCINAVALYCIEQ
jgi:hypothetical protein